MGFSVAATWNGKEALDYLIAAQDGLQRKPDIILMDVQMPVIDGYKCTHLLRRHLPYKALAQGVPIVAMTASAIQGDRERCRKTGMDDYLAKPVKSKTLEKMLVRWSLSRRQESTPSLFSSKSVCSEISEKCEVNNIHAMRLDDFFAGDEQFNIQTGRPVTTDGQRVASESRLFTVGQSDANEAARRIMTDEWTRQPRDDELWNAAGRGQGSRTTSPHPASNCSALTEENVEKLN